MHAPIPMPDAMNGYQAQSLPDTPFRAPGHPGHDFASPPAPVVMVGEEMGDAASMYQPVDRAPPRYGIEAARVPPSPGKVHQGWPLDGHRLDTAFSSKPLTWWPHRERR